MKAKTVAPCVNPSADTDCLCLPHERASMAGVRRERNWPDSAPVAALLGLMVLVTSSAFGQWPEEAPLGATPVQPALVAPQQAAPSASAYPPSTSPAAIQESPAENDTVVQVRVAGHGHIPMQKILPHIKSRAGRPYSLELIEEDVRRLSSSGMFVTVRPLSQRVDGGWVVIYQVIERPLLTGVFYVGNQAIKKKKLSAEAGIKAGDPADPFDVAEARRRLEEYYHSKGFSSARVAVVEGDRPEDRRVVFLINEGNKQRILWTGFVGNTIASDARLRTQIRSKPGMLWFFKGEVNRDEIEEDINRLTAYYRSLGFFRAKIGRELSFNEEQNWLTLTFVIDEGPRYAVRNIAFIGNSKFSTDELNGRLELNPGDYFSQTQMALDVAKVREKYGRIGYVFADVDPDMRFDEEPGQLDLVYKITEGERYRAGRIDVDIAGEYPHTQWSTVLNRVSVWPGDIVDTRKLRESERRMRASQLFEANPAEGKVPQIVLSAPEVDDVDGEGQGVQNVAKGPGQSGRARFQSPDPTPLVTNLYRQPVDRTATGAPAAASTPAHPSGTGLERSAMALDHALQDPTLPVPNGTSTEAQSPAPADAGEWRDPGMRLQLTYVDGEPQWVVRGQYSADAGRSLPPLARSASPIPASAPGTNSTVASTAPFDPYATSPSSATAAPNQTGTVAPAQYLNTEPSPNGEPFNVVPEDNLPLYIPLNPRVEETRTGRFMLSVGVNSDAGVLGSIVLEEQNFDITRWPSSWYDIRNGTAWRGAGQRFRVEAVPGTRVQRYTINFEEPYLFDTNVSLGLSGFYFTRNYYEWDEERTGGRVALGYQFTPDLSGSVAFRGAEITVTDPIRNDLDELNEVLGNNTLLGVRSQLAYDTRDSSFLATEGYYIELGFEQVFGTFEYPRADVEVRRYFTLHERPDGSGRHVLALNGRAGWSGDDTPIYEHFFIGGFTTIRGFDFRGASPSRLGVFVGGEFQLLASAEYMFPITADDMIRGVVFVDSGTVEPKIDEWTDNFRVAPGFGLRITVPAMGPAPIALDLAVPIMREGTDDIRNFNFSVGWTR